MPHDALGRLGGARGDPRARGRPRRPRPPGRGTRLTPPAPGGPRFGATLLLTALSLSTFPGATAPATRAAGSRSPPSASSWAGLGPRSRPASSRSRLTRIRSSPPPRRPRGVPLLAVVALAFLESAFARRLRAGRLAPSRPARHVHVRVSSSSRPVPRSRPPSAAEPLALLLRGPVDPLFVNALGMTAAERTRDAALTFLGRGSSSCSRSTCSRLSLDPEGRDRLLLWACAEEPPRCSSARGPLPTARSGFP